MPWTKATIVDSNGQFSDQIDIVLFDRQYTPLIFEHQNEIVVPVEAVYALFEAKQEIKARVREICTAEGRDRTPSPSHERARADDRWPSHGNAAAYSGGISGF